MTCSEVTCSCKLEICGAHCPVVVKRTLCTVCRSGKVDIMVVLRCHSVTVGLVLDSVWSHVSIHHVLCFLPINTCLSIFI